MPDVPIGTDTYRACIAASLIESLKKVDAMIFHCPILLDTAGEVRSGLEKMIRELEGHADV